MSASGGRAVAHLKLPVFQCRRRVAGSRRNYTGCTGRRVEYADLATPALRAGQAAGVAGLPSGAQVQLTGEFTGYRYGPGADHSPELVPRWTGHRWGVRMAAFGGEPRGGSVPDGPITAGGGPAEAYVATGDVTIIAPGGTGSATDDSRYPNLLLVGGR